MRATRAGTQALVADVRRSIGTSANPVCARIAVRFRALAHRKSATAACRAQSTAVRARLRCRQRVCVSVVELRRPRNAAKLVRETQARAAGSGSRRRATGERRAQRQERRRRPTPARGRGSSLAETGPGGLRCAPASAIRRRLPSSAATISMSRGPGCDVGHCQQRRNDELARRGSRHSAPRAAGLGDVDGRLDPAHPPIVAGQLHALTDGVGERRGSRLRPGAAIRSSNGTLRSPRWPPPGSCRRSRASSDRRRRSAAGARPAPQGTGCSAARPSARGAGRTRACAGRCTGRHPRPGCGRRSSRSSRQAVRGSISARKRSASRARSASPGDDRSRLRASGACLRPVPSRSARR